MCVCVFYVCLFFSHLFLFALSSILFYNLFSLYIYVFFLSLSLLIPFFSLSLFTHQLFLFHMYIVYIFLLSFPPTIKSLPHLPTSLLLLSFPCLSPRPSPQPALEDPPKKTEHGRISCRSQQVTCDTCCMTHLQTHTFALSLSVSVNIPGLGERKTERFVS